MKVSEAIEKFQRIKLGAKCGYFFCGEHCTREYLEQEDARYLKLARRDLRAARAWLKNDKAEGREKKVEKRVTVCGMTIVEAERSYEQYKKRMQSQRRLRSKYIREFIPIIDREVIEIRKSIAPWTRGYVIVICEGEELGRMGDVGMEI